MHKNRILFAISSLGLWHATRSLAIIKYYLDKWYNIDIISFWNTLNYLKNELKNYEINFFNFQDYPALERGEWLFFYFYLFIDLINSKKIIKKENNFTKNIENNYDFIISDWRYWIYSKNIPSFLISHQLSFIMPKWLELFQKLSDKENIKYFKNFNKIFIVDYEDKNNNLAWRLSHPKWINKINYKYIWILSDFYFWDKNKNSTKKINYLFTITWYLQKHKKEFIDELIYQAKKLNWRKIFLLWDTSKKYKKQLENNICLYSYIWWQKKMDLFNNADIIVSRSWYTTIMDLVELEKKAILFPTPNQTEQEYLAEYLWKENKFVIWGKNFNLTNLVKKLKNINILKYKEKTKEALEKIDEEIKKYL